MEIRTYKTPKVVVGDDLFAILDQNLPKLSEKSVVVVTSKIVSICQGHVIKNDSTVERIALIKKEAQWFVRPGMSKYNASLSIKNNILVSAAGIDESNGNGYYILWPKNPFKSAQTIWSHLRKKYAINNLGVVITDSVTVPMRWGTRGVSIAWCGIEPLRSYIDQPDIFGRKLKYTKLSIVDCIATAAVLAMGEGQEQTPLAVCYDIPNIVFTAHPPTDQEIADLQIDPVDDVFAPLMDLSKWEKGEARQ